VVVWNSASSVAVLAQNYMPMLKWLAEPEAKHSGTRT
jgi:hypothetical protein